jgi:tRNA(Ile)-lysidine synthase TilS/MesJ
MNCVTCGGALTPSSGEWWMALQWVHEDDRIRHFDRTSRPLLPADWREQARAWADAHRGPWFGDGAPDADRV